ncbi:MAG: type IX secretion system membrane protein PorP/SprF [Chlorobi bacterium]|nr:type IX secretion system membrane protein PorP/SprF [Chlorobiota bacterium]
MRIFYIVTFVLALFTFSGAAQDIVFSQNMFYKDNINPSSFLISNDLNVFLLYNNNLGGNFDMNPQTQVADINIVKDNHKLGLFVINDKLGYDKIQNIKVRYAQRFQISNNSSFSLGLAVGVVHRKLEVTRLIFETPDDPLSYQDYSHTWFDYDFGAEFQYNKLYIGLSTTHFGKIFNPEENEVLTAHFYGYIQYAYSINKVFMLYPNLIARQWKGSFFVEPGLTAFYKKTAWTGISFSDFQDLSVSIGMKVHKNIMFGYAYRANLNRQILNPFVSNTNEVFLNFSMNRQHRNIKTPRFID